MTRGRFSIHPADFAPPRCLCGCSYEDHEEDENGRLACCVCDCSDFAEDDSWADDVGEARRS